MQRQLHCVSATCIRIDCLGNRAEKDLPPLCCQTQNRAPGPMEELRLAHCLCCRTCLNCILCVPLSACCSANTYPIKHSSAILKLCQCINSFFIVYGVKTPSSYFCPCAVLKFICTQSQGSTKSSQGNQKTEFQQSSYMSFRNIVQQKWTRH